MIGAKVLWHNGIQPNLSRRSRGARRPLLGQGEVIKAPRGGEKVRGAGLRSAIAAIAACAIAGCAAGEPAAPLVRPLVVQVPVLHDPVSGAGAGGPGAADRRT
jgi:hypothetical protein